MAYIPPDGDAIAFVFADSYTVPDGDDLSFNFVSDIEISIPEISIVFGAALSNVTGDIYITVPDISIPIGAECHGIEYAVSVPEIAFVIGGSVCRVIEGQLVTVPEILISIGGSAVFNLAISVPEVSITIGGTVIPNFAVRIGEAVIVFGAVTGGAATFNTTVALIRYYLTVTGAEDDIADIEIPMASFQARRRNGDPTYLSVVIPSADFASAIAARPNGSIRIDQGYVQGGSILQRELIMEAPISDAAVYQGGRQSSIVLTGYGTTSYTPKAITLTNAVYRSVTGGKIHYRLARPYIFLNPGDTVTIEDDTFVIGTMSYAISPAQQQIELQEA